MSVEYWFSLDESYPQISFFFHLLTSWSSLKGHRCMFALTEGRWLASRAWEVQGDWAIFIPMSDCTREDALSKPWACTFSKGLRTGVAQMWPSHTASLVCEIELPFMAILKAPPPTASSYTRTSSSPILSASLNCSIVLNSEPNAKRRQNMHDHHLALSAQ